MSLKLRERSCLKLLVIWRFGGGRAGKGVSEGAINSVEARPASVETQKSREGHVS